MKGKSRHLWHLKSRISLSSEYTYVLWYAVFPLFVLFGSVGVVMQFVSNPTSVEISLLILFIPLFLAFVIIIIKLKYCEYSNGRLFVRNLFGNEKMYSLKSVKKIWTVEQWHKMDFVGIRTTDGKKFWFIRRWSSKKSLPF